MFDFESACNRTVGIVIIFFVLFTCRPHKTLVETASLFNCVKRINLFNSNNYNDKPLPNSLRGIVITWLVVKHFMLMQDEMEKISN